MNRSDILQASGESVCGKNEQEKHKNICEDCMYYYKKHDLCIRQKLLLSCLGTIGNCFREWNG